MNVRSLSFCTSLLLVSALALAGCDSKDSEAGDAGGASSGQTGDGDGDGDSAGDGDGDGGGNDSASSGDGDGDGDSAGDGDDCGTFLGCNDTPDGTIEMCDFWAQDCPAGEKCTAIASTPGDGAWDANVCVPAGDAAPGSDCMLADGPQGTDTCDEKGMCYDQDPDTMIGTCVEFCQGPESAPSCPVSSVQCSKLNGGVLNLCIEQCDPLLQACPMGQGCYAAFNGRTLDGFICFPPAVQAEAGEACGECDNCCRPGLGCAPAPVYGPGCTDAGCCTEWCDVNNNGSECSGAGQSCIALFQPGTPNEDIGWCGVPQ